MYCNDKPNIYDNSQCSLTIGQRNVRFGKYNWRVLDVQNGKALLLTEDVIERCCYHSSGKKTTWEECELREYLNGAFLQTFSSLEQSQIASVTNANPDNPWYGIPGGKNTTDKIFLLSIDEVVKYFGDSGDLQARKGWYWEDPGQSVLKDEQGYFINDQYNEARIGIYRSKNTWWWLRSPGGYGRHAVYVNSDGCLYIYGVYVDFDIGGVRPALWLNL